MKLKNTFSRIKDINFGSIEAKHEMVGASDAIRKQFESSFVNPSSIDLDDFIKGNRYIVYGLKGTGKTALMHFASLQAKKEGYQTRFQLFSRDVTEQDRQNLSRAAGFNISDDNLKGINQDFEAVWLWFFHRHIAQILSENETTDSSEKQKYVKFIEYISGDDEDSWKTKLWRLLPRFRNGKIEVKGKTPVMEASIASEFEKGGGVNEIKLTRAAERANELLSEIPCIAASLLMFVDELELSLGRTEDFIRDGRAISGLIRAAARINEILRIKSV